MQVRASIAKQLKRLVSIQIPHPKQMYCSYIANVKGKEMHYIKAGEGPPLLLLHGLSHSWEGWIPLIEELRSSFTVYALDLPGFGDTASWEEYSIEVNALAVHDFLEEIELHPVCIAGASMGSLITTELICSYPYTTDSAILIGPFIKDRNTARLAETLTYSMHLIQKFDLSEAALKKLMEIRFTIYAIAKWMNMYEFNKELVKTYNLTAKKKMRKEAYTQMTVACSQYHMNDKVKEVTIPTLLLYGREDKISSPEFARKEVLPHNKNLTVIDIPEAGHIVPLEKTAEVATAITEYIRNNTQSENN